MTERMSVFEYPACEDTSGEPGWRDWLETDESSGVNRAESQGREECEERARSFEAGRERGREEGRAMEREAQAGVRKNEEERYKLQLAKLMGDFATERDRFLEAAEKEVVKLALAVAARILRREAQMDPLLLTGAVRVALGQLAGTTEVQLKVPVAQLQLWRDAVRLIPNLNLKPEVVAGEGMRIGDCVIESKLGTVDLGVRSQLVEIERGFFDRGGTGVREEQHPARTRGQQDEAGA